MVKFPGTMQFLVFIFLLLVLSVNPRPQNYDENLYWRSQPRSISNNGYYNNQRYNQPSDYQTSGIYRTYPTNPQNYDSFGYHRPRMQPEQISLLRPKARGPQKDVLAAQNEQNEFNVSNGVVVATENQAQDRSDRRFEASNKKETTRILNSPPRQAPKPDPSNDEAMLGDQSDSFVFPGNPILQSSSTTTPAPTNLKPGVNPYIPDVSKIMSMCPPDATFCLYPGNYPSEHIKTALKKSTEKFDDLFGRDEIASNISISTRIDVTLDGNPMCGSKEQVIQPPVAKNKDNEWRFIVNDGPYIQGIRVEMCEKPGNTCAMSENFPLSYTTECKQKYIYRKLLALESNGQIEPDNFRLPSCCTCIYRQDPTLKFIKPSFGTSRRRK